MNENSLNYLQWLTLNRSRLSLEVEERMDIKNVLSSYSNLKVSISFEGTKYTGYGIANSDDLALVKGSIEAFERMIANDQDNCYTTNGIAAHLNVEGAEKAASLELIERDDFFYYYFTKKKLEIFNPQECEKSVPEYRRISKYCYDNNLKLYTYILRETNEFTTVATVIRDIDDGMILSLGIGDKKNQAILSSLLQAFRKALTIYAIKRDPSFAYVSNNIMDKKPIHHLNMGLSPGYYHDFISHFSNSMIPSNELFLENIKVVSLVPQSNNIRRLINEAGIVCSKATSPIAQSLFFGDITSNIFNAEKFRKSGISYCEVTDFIPHPMA